MRATAAKVPDYDARVTCVTMCAVHGPDGGL